MKRIEDKRKVSQKNKKKYAGKNDASHVIGINKNKWNTKSSKE